MTLTLDLKPEAEAELIARAQERGVPVDTYVLQVVSALLETPMPEETVDFLEDDIPILQPSLTRRTPMRFVSVGALKFPAVDDSDLVDLDD